MRKTNHIFRVAVAFDLEYAAFRDMLIGLSDYIHRHHRLWQIRIFPHPKFFPDALRSESFDGFILGEVAVDLTRSELRGIDKPIVITGSPADFPPPHGGCVAFVHNDNLRFGRMGAQHLASLGHFRSFGFVHEPGAPVWSRQRAEGFRTALAKDGIKVTDQGDRPLADYLRCLPKPAAVMCANDKVGTDVIATCNTERIKVPQNMSVLGVDNDFVLCEITSPPLSSIQSNHRKYGVLLATALDRMLRSSKPVKSTELVIDDFRLVQRRSTMPPTSSAHLVGRAIAYVKANAMRDIGVDDVVAQLGVSRQLACLRFKEASSETLSQFIRGMRLAEVAKRLRNTRQPIIQIAKTCSFGNLQHLANAFKRQYGVSMTDYRASKANRKT